MKTIINSKKVEINKPTKTVIDFLSDVRNYKPIMPSGVSNFSAPLKNKCFYSFGGTSINMETKGVNEKSVVLVSNTFPNMTLTVRVDSGFAEIMFSADLTAMQKLLFSGQMQRFCDEILAKLKKTLE
jgi:hypothetical protein